MAASTWTPPQPQQQQQQQQQPPSSGWSGSQACAPPPQPTSASSSSSPPPIEVAVLSPGAGWTLPTPVGPPPNSSSSSHGQGDLSPTSPPSSTSPRVPGALGNGIWLPDPAGVGGAPGMGSGGNGERDWNGRHAPPGLSFAPAPARPAPAPAPVATAPAPVATAPVAAPPATVPPDEQASAKKTVPGKSARLPVVLSYLKCSVATAKRLREVRLDRIFDNFFGSYEAHMLYLCNP